MCTCVYVRVCVRVRVKKINIYIYILLHFVFKETTCIDEGRCICMSVCMYVELNWFPGKEKKKEKKWIMMNELINERGGVMFVTESTSYMRPMDSSE